MKGYREISECCGTCAYLYVDYDQDQECYCTADGNTRPTGYYDDKGEVAIFRWVVEWKRNREVKQNGVCGTWTKAEHEED